MINIFELKKSSIIDNTYIKKYFNPTIDKNEKNKIRSLVDYRKIYEYNFLNQYKYNDVVSLLSNTEIFNEKNWINHIRHLVYYNKYLIDHKHNRLNYNFIKINSIQEFYTLLKKHYEYILKKEINPFKNLSKRLNKQGNFILTLYDNSLTMIKYKIPYNILTEGDLLNLCILRLKELLIYIYPNLKDILTPNILDEKYKRTKIDKTQTNKLKEQNINDEMIIKYLLPFINSEYFKDIYKIKSINELYTKKIDKQHNDQENKYYYTNYSCDHTLSISKEDQFFKQSKSIYTSNNSKNGIIPYTFNVDDFILNANAIFKTIIYTENKMYVNWINVFPYVPSYELLKDTLFYNRHKYLPSIKSKLDITELFFFATLDYNILETPIDDLLFMNNTINAYYCKHFNNNWYSLSYNEIDNLLNNNKFIEEINTEHIIKSLYTQGKITDILVNDYKQLNKQLYLDYINKKINNIIKTKNDYDNIIQFFLNDQNKYREYIIKICKDAYYFMPINYIDLKEFNKIYMLSTQIDYEHFKDIQTNINLKIINDMFMFYNRKNKDKFDYFELYTYFYKFMITLLSESNQSTNIISFDFNTFKKYYNNYFKNPDYKPSNDKLFNNGLKNLLISIEVIYELKYNNKKSDYIQNMFINQNQLKKEYKYNIDCIKDIYEKFIKELNIVLEYCYNNNYEIEVNDSEKYNILDKEINKQNSQYVFNKNVEKINGYLYHTYWGEFFSMYYLEQINIFNKYLNNRIIYATGGTGTGKSTQLPKLLLFAGSVIDNINSYHILCSEPRQRPTKENAINISKQFSSPILQEDFDSKHNNLEYYIQYKHGNDKTHYFNNKKYPVLMFATDKIVYQNVCNNPLCCSYKCYTNLNKIITNEVYNMIIVDEAHEHNVNMDFILSIMKYYCQHNNKIKLVIISATMDADEDKYRKFYDTVNDMIYPHTIKTIYNEDFLENRKIINPKTNQIYTYEELNDDNLELSNDNKQKLYQVVDRRLDISEPNKTTIYKITDIYKDMTSLELSDENLKDKKITEIIFEILKDKNAKDILVFKSGSKPINKLVKEINDKLPYDTIALPYYSALNDTVKDFIEKLSQYHDVIDIDKSIDISQLTSIEKFINGGPAYKHYILIATNIAEASITIPTLSHVIDDGIQNVSRFDYKYESTGLSIGYIANTNRLQRRGRVGRKADGTVYYLYKEGALDGQQPEYNICNSNIVPDLVELFTDNSLKNKLITENTKLNNKINQHDLLIAITNINYLLSNIQIENIVKNGLLYVSFNNLQIINDKENIINQLDMYQLSIDYINNYCINGNINLKVNDNVIINTNGKYQIIMNKILLYPNLSIDDFIEQSLDKDKRKIPWFESYKLNKKYTGYLKIEDESIFDNMKKIYDKIKIIFMSSICATNSDENEKENNQLEDKFIYGGNKILDQFQKKEYIKYKCGFYYDVLLDVQYNFFNISPDQKNIKRDLFGNIIFINEIMSNNMRKYLMNTYKGLSILDYSINNNRIIHTNEYELINSLTLNLQSHYLFLPQIIVGLCLAYLNNCVDLYIIYASIILNYDELFSKLKLDRNIKFDSELQYFVNQYINKDMNTDLYNKVSSTINMFNNIINNKSTENDIFNVLIISYKNILNLENVSNETERIIIILIYIFKNKLVVNLPSEYLKIIHPIRRTNIIIGPNSKIPMYIYRNIYTSISNPSQNVIKRYDDNNNCNEHDFVLYLSDKLENDGLNSYVIISLTIPFNPNYLKYVNINKNNILSQLNKPSIDIYYRRCLEMLLKYI